MPSLQREKYMFKPKVRTFMSHPDDLDPRTRAEAEKFGKEGYVVTACMVDEYAGQRRITMIAYQASVFSDSM